MAINLVRKSYDNLKSVPGGKAIFSVMVGRAAPFTGTIGGRVALLEEGHAVVRMRDRRAVRNHLNSVHAIAMMNLAEMTTGLAFIYGLPDDARAILTGLSIDYLKKGRGTLTGECWCEVPSDNRRREVEVKGVITDEAGDKVALAVARWLLGPKKG